MTEEAWYTLGHVQRDTDLCLEILREPVADLLAVNVPPRILAGVLVQLLIETARRDREYAMILAGAIESLSAAR